MPYLVKDKRTPTYAWKYLTVAELIEILQKLPQDAAVVHEYDSMWGPLYPPRLLTTDMEEEGDAHFSTELDNRIQLVWINPEMEEDE